MKNLILLLSISFWLVGCSAPADTNSDDNEKSELGPKPDSVERNKESQAKSKRVDCTFNDPDTSIAGIVIGNPRSTTKIIGQDNKIDDFGQYHFYTKLDREILTLTQHPGDAGGQISIFRIAYSGKADYGYRQLPIDTLKTEKGIRLGLSKRQVIERLGRCYVAKDSAKNKIALLYKIKSPNDSRTGLLGRFRVPVYYASYNFSDDKLIQFEFGFEYP